MLIYGDLINQKQLRVHHTSLQLLMIIQGQFWTFLLVDKTQVFQTISNFLGYVKSQFKHVLRTSEQTMEVN